MYITHHINYISKYEWRFEEFYKANTSSHNTKVFYFFNHNQRNTELLLLLFFFKIDIWKMLEVTPDCIHFVGNSK